MKPKERASLAEIAERLALVRAAKDQWGGGPLPPWVLEEVLPAAESGCNRDRVRQPVERPRGP